MSQASSDERWMRRAFDLAQHGRWTTWPNPMVGCVVVKDDQTLGEGWHEHHGEAHAEVNALRQIAPMWTLAVPPRTSRLSHAAITEKRRRVQTS